MSFFSQGPVTVPLSSLVLNSLNFLLFDLLLAAVVYYLTAEIAGLTNSISALHEKEDGVVFHSPGFMGVGVGITCTRRRVFYTLAMLRLASLFFIFMTSLSFVGGTNRVLLQTEADVVELGKFGVHEDFETLKPRKLLREGCQGLDGSTMYFGEIRARADCARSAIPCCELNISRMAASPIRFDVIRREETVNLSSCTARSLNESRYVCDGALKGKITCSDWATSTEICSVFGSPSEKCEAENARRVAFTCGRNRTRYGNCERTVRDSYLAFHCKNAIVSCKTNVRPSSRDCFATVNIWGVTNLCSSRKVYDTLQNKSQQGGVQNISNLTFQCRKAVGAKWNISDWVPYIDRDLFTMEHAYAALYGSGKERRTVRFEKGKQITTISWAWFVMFGLKLIMILSLACIILFMQKWKGYKKVANDEVGLGNLLRVSKTNSHRFYSANHDPTPETSGDGDNILVEMDEGVIRLCAETGDGFYDEKH